MAYIKNTDPNGVRILTDHGIAVESGEWAEVPDDVAESLAEQSVWEIVTANGKPIKAANARAEKVAEAETEVASQDLPLPEAEPQPDNNQAEEAK